MTEPASENKGKGDGRRAGQGAETTWECGEMVGGRSCNGNMTGCRGSRSRVGKRAGSNCGYSPNPG